MNPLSRLSATFLRDHPDAAARVLEDFPADSSARYLAVATPLTAVHVIEHFTPGYAAGCLLCIEPQAAGQIFTQLLPDLQIMLLRLLDRDKRESLLGALPSDQAVSIQGLLPYPDGTAGALMEAPLASVPEELSVRDALKRVKRIRRGMNFYVYASSAAGQLTGVMTLHELINAQPARRISQVMQRRVVTLSAAQSLLTVFNSPYWQDYHALPVTDGNNVLIGVIRQNAMRRFQAQLRQRSPVSNALGAFIATGELFAVTAGQLLAAFISSGTSVAQVPRD